MTDGLLSELHDLLGPNGLLTGADVSARPAGWGQERGCSARAILRPRSTDQVAQILSLCQQAKQPVVPQGGMTGLVEGGFAGPDELVLSLELMREIGRVDTLNRTVTVGAGVSLQAAQQVAADAGLQFAVDLGARGSATIGGAIATNAGGTHVLRYGMMRENVLGLEAVLADGTVVSALDETLKNNAGYDLKHMFLGSEGTLGIVTRAVLRLRQKPVSRVVLLAGLPDFTSVVTLLGALDSGLGGTLSAFEVMWNDFYCLTTTPPAAQRPPLPQHFPLYVLAECMGSNQTEDLTRVERMLADCLDSGVIGDAALAHSQTQCDEFWAVRENVEQLWRFAPIFNFDVSLSVTHMETYTRGLQTIIRERWPEGRCFLFGHLGDGNLHVSVATGSEADRNPVEAAVYEPLGGFGGSVSAEHGIGLEKRRWLNVTRTPEAIALMRTLKRALDPDNILNPGKVLLPD